MRLAKNGKAVVNVRLVSVSVLICVRLLHLTKQSRSQFYETLLFLLTFFRYGGKDSLLLAMFISSLPNVQTLLLVTV